ncbi:hypothetical protein ASE65_10635 [Sphingomonas sp. Leaf16]|nr:hypothetical protein ASE65_10635 [Sphingomonas sp. Leaf16]KQN11067.1 hypothetical protein ASE81_11625 [Sphingomonas sp. Leaf29]
MSKDRGERSVLGPIDLLLGVSFPSDASSPPVTPDLSGSTARQSVRREALSIVIAARWTPE